MSSARHPMLLHEKKAKKKGYKTIAGCDESGVGSLAGPLVAAAVILNDFKFENRIDDSKRLTPRNRLRAYDEIVRKATYGIAVISRDIIDRVNVYNASRLALEGAVRSLRIDPEYVLVDGIIKLSFAYDGESIKQGDQRSLSIACASILAKVTRDGIMAGLHERYPQYGFRHNKGYGTLFHFKAIRRYGPSPVHRLTFDPLKSLIEEGCTCFQTSR